MPLLSRILANMPDIYRYFNSISYIPELRVCTANVYKNLKKHAKTHIVHILTNHLIILLSCRTRAVRQIVRKTSKRSKTLLRRACE